VHCKDQHCGKLVKLVVDPQTQQVTDLVVEKGLLLKQDRVIPVSTIERVTEREIYLNLRSHEVSTYPEYHQVEIKVPAPDAPAYASSTTLIPGYGTIREPVVPLVRKRVHQGIAAGQAVIGRGTEVESQHKALGHVDHVVVDTQTGRISQLVLRRGLFPEYVVIPAEQIKDVDEQGVFLSVTDAALTALPRYTPRLADEILADLYDRLHETLPSPFESVKATVEGGVLVLTGCVRSKALQSHAEAHARAIAGVIDVQNELLIEPDRPTETTTDEPASLTTQVYAALAADPRTQQAVIEVIADRGVVTLQGQVATTAVREAAAEIARQQRGVTAVINELMVPRA